jgi:pyruvate kinase
VGGELRSRKGLNLPGIELGIGAFTDHDRECLRFALEHGVDAVSQSFVESAADVCAVRQAAAALGHRPFLIAKIERRHAVDRVDDILTAADGIMIARGDLGVEVPIERIAILQKTLVRKAVRLGKPVITATQMLESMTQSRQPTRAEATDVANAILDGTDCVMLSAESASGKYPVESVATLARIAAATEPHRSRADLRERLRALPEQYDPSLPDLLAVAAEAVMEFRKTAAVVIPTETGLTARSVARFRLPVWIAAVTTTVPAARRLHFSYGVEPELRPDPPPDWNAFTREWVAAHGLTGATAIVLEGPSARRGRANHTMDLIDLGAALRREPEEAREVLR